jgi:hypothetical protein
MDENNYLKTPISLIFNRSLKSTDKIVVQYLMWRQGNNDTSWPAIRTIARDLGISCSTVQESIRRLENKIIAITKSGKKGKGNSNHYTIIVPEIGTIPFNNCTEKQHNIVPTISTNIVPKNSTENKPVKINNKNKPIFRPNSIEYGLAELLLNEILKRKRDFKKSNLQKWTSDIDLMIRKDGRKPEQIEAVIRWTQQDSFWQNNVLSTAKLREKFDQLEMKMKQKSKQIIPQINFSEQKSAYGECMEV